MIEMELYRSPTIASSSRSQEQPPEGREVLVIDDSPSVRMVVQRMLRPLGYRVSEARSGREALERLQHGPLPELILCDMLMDDLSGVEICRRLRSIDRWRHLPVVLISGQSTEEMGAQATGAGVDRLLRKPFRAETLTALIDELLSSSPRGSDLGTAEARRPPWNLGPAQQFLDRLSRLRGLRSWRWSLPNGRRGGFTAQGGSPPPHVDVEALLTSLRTAAAPFQLGSLEMCTLQDGEGGALLVGSRLGAGALVLHLDAQPEGADPQRDGPRELTSARYLVWMFLRTLPP